MDGFLMAFCILIQFLSWKIDSLGEGLHKLIIHKHRIDHVPKASFDRLARREHFGKPLLLPHL